MRLELAPIGLHRIVYEMTVHPRPASHQSRPLSKPIAPYSVIKRISPPMDELALNSYIRASRKMKDAFEAYYASDEGHGDYLTFLAALLQDAADQAGLGPFMNMGGTSGSIRRRR